MDNAPETHVCSFSRDIQAPGNSGKGQRRKRRSSSLASYSKAKQTDRKVENPSKEGNRGESSSVKILCRYRNSNPLACENTSLRMDANLAINAFSDQKEAHQEVEEREVQKGSVA